MQILGEVLELPQDSFRVPSPHSADPTRRRYLTPAFVVKPKVETVAGNAECRSSLGRIPCQGTLQYERGLASCEPTINIGTRPLQRNNRRK
jgi:hypothetical protein